MARVWARGVEPGSGGSVDFEHVDESLAVSESCVLNGVRATRSWKARAVIIKQSEAEDNGSCSHLTSAGGASVARYTKARIPPLSSLIR